MDYKEELVEAPDGIRLFLRRWRPSGRVQARGALVIVHGLRDQSSRYHSLATRLANERWAVYCADLRGSGHSGGGRARLDNTFPQHVGDLAFLIQRAGTESNVPVFVLGHSLGGTIAALYAGTTKPRISGLILSAACLKYSETSDWLDTRNFARDTDVVRESSRDPLVPGGSPITTALALRRAIEQVRYRADSISLPIFMLHGEADRVVPVGSTREFFALVRSEDRTIHTFPEAYHDLPRDEPDEFASEVIAWLNAKGRP